MATSPASSTPRIRKIAVSIYMSTGGAPQGVLAAAALRCIGGQMQCRLVLDSDEKRERAARMGITDPQMIFSVEDMVRGRLPVCCYRRYPWRSGVRRQISQAFHRD